MKPSLFYLAFAGVPTLVFSITGDGSYGYPSRARRGSHFVPALNAGPNMREVSPFLQQS